MSSFHDVSFPLSLAFGASGGPSRRTDITQLASGREHRNTPHAASRRRYNAGAGVKTIDELHDLITFFEARMGQLHSFRFQDPLDYKSCKTSATISATDQILGTGDGERSKFLLTKTYEDAGGSYSRTITLPVKNNLVIALNGSPVLSEDVTFDTQSAEVVLTTPPPSGAIVTAGFEFDVPVRFDTNQLDITLEAFGAGQLINIPLIEVKEYA